MVYLSQLLNKPLYFKEEKYAKIIDFGLPVELQTPVISTILIRKDGQKYEIPTSQIQYKNNTFVLTNLPSRLKSYDVTDFFLAEDLLDKQVIDVTGRRLVRVNDVVLKVNGNFQVIGIGIGFAGILRRLGINTLNPLRPITIPWSQIEAFDYETGDVRIKLGKSTLNTLHPSDIADILEEAGSKERMGVVEALDAQTAAAAIEEADPETQQSILEELPEDQLKNIVRRMPVSEIADIIDELNSETIKEIFTYLGKDKAKKLRKLSQFADDVAGGLMTISFIKSTADTSVGELYAKFIPMRQKPEGVIITTYDDTLVGIVETRNLINVDPTLSLKSVMKEPYAVHQDTIFPDILKLFAEYNLRILPVIDNTDKVIGIITIDAILAEIQEEGEQDVEL